MSKKGWRTCDRSMDYGAILELDGDLVVNEGLEEAAPQLDVFTKEHSL